MSSVEENPRAQSPSLREESGYASAASSADSLPEVIFSKPHLKFLNTQLQKLEPQGELRCSRLQVRWLTT
jgi:phosphoadenosine phosphosulfate reductase